MTKLAKVFASTVPQFTGWQVEKTCPPDSTKTIKRYTFYLFFLACRRLKGETRLWKSAQQDATNLIVHRLLSPRYTVFCQMIYVMYRLCMCTVHYYYGIALPFSGGGVGFEELHRGNGFFPNSHVYFYIFYRPSEWASVTVLPYGR